jgi:hypothetical protein
LHTFLDTDCQYNRKLVLACGLITIPSRRIFDRRLKTISTDIKERISTMGCLFVVEGLVDLSIIAADSTLIKAKDSVWYKTSMEKGEVPRPGIDTGARWWVYSHTNKGQIFGYKLHLTPTTGDLIVPLTADVTTTANVQDNQMYVSLTSHSSSYSSSYSSVFSLPSALYM